MHSCVKTSILLNYLLLSCFQFFLGFGFFFNFAYLKKISDNVLMIKSYIRSVTYLLITWNLFEQIWHASHIIIHRGDIETNPGPKHSFSSQDLIICHLNLNSLYHTCTRKCLYCRPTFLSTNLTLFVFE